MFAVLNEVRLFFPFVLHVFLCACFILFQGITAEAKRMARHSVRVGLALYNAGAAQSAQLYQEAALLRVHKVSEDTDVEKLEGQKQPSCYLFLTSPVLHT